MEETKATEQEGLLNYVEKLLTDAGVAVEVSLAVQQAIDQAWSSVGVDRMAVQQLQSVNLNLRMAQDKLTKLGVPTNHDPGTSLMPATPLTLHERIQWLVTKESRQIEKEEHFSLEEYLKKKNWSMGQTGNTWIDPAGRPDYNIYAAVASQLFWDKQQGYGVVRLTLQGPAIDLSPLFR